MKALRNLIILGLIGWVVWIYVFQQGPGDRPPVLVSNGPLRIEVPSETGNPGDFQKGLMNMGQSWYHHHPAHGPSRFEVVVTDSSCGSEARYDATELIVLAGGGGTSSRLTISVGGGGPPTYLEVAPDIGTGVRQDPASPTRLDVGGPDEQLQTVRVAGATCAFSPGEGSITINQRHDG